MPDGLDLIRKEIAEMKMSENRLEFSVLVQEIIKEFNILKQFIEDLPEKFVVAEKAGKTPLVKDLYLVKDGFLCDGCRVKIFEGKYIEIFKDKKKVFEFRKKNLMGDMKELEKIVKKIATLSEDFQDFKKAEMVVYQQKVLEDIKGEF